MFFYGIIIFGVLFDLITKYGSGFLAEEKIALVGEWIFLQRVKNDGIAFGIDIPALKFITIVLIFALFYYYFQEKKAQTGNQDASLYLFDTAWGVLLAGAIGNAIERILYGSVTDFIAVQGFAIFNVADSLITLGATLYIYYLYRTGAWNHKKSNSKK